MTPDVVISFLVGTAVAAAGIWLFARAGRLGGPARSLRVTRDLQAIKWGDGVDNLASLDATFVQLSALYDRELSYYYARRSRASTAKLLRWVAWVVGTAGVLCPLIAPTISGEDSALTAQIEVFGLSVALVHAGYLLLAFAGALLAGNRFFGLTEGHIRYATAQLELDAHLSALNFGWVELKAQAAARPSDGLHLSAAFALLEKGRKALHDTVLKETAQWAEQTAAQEAAHAASLK